jgi:hypothetical protein
MCAGVALSARIHETSDAREITLFEFGNFTADV